MGMGGSQSVRIRWNRGGGYSEGGDERRDR